MNQQFPPHPAVLEALDLADAVTAEYDRYLEMIKGLQDTSWDSTKTVAVTVGHNGELGTIWIKPGTKKIGATALAERINEALAASNAAVATGKESIQADHQREFAALRERNAVLREMIDAGPLAQPVAQGIEAPSDRW
ncbi:Uncharacterised protein [Mycobacteroides abscessus subsp. abscessus]|uniref:hypothetical protein n=1 Tax=Mycobacteroides abscessus TaxID=36809 RepID=UPI00092BB15C|nr:hypothetical protein [Mycobacteroides abscessus]SHU25366.1 Uncharacterised protein [Mycobacteroides abscessus subsp. abscessus]